METLLKSDYVGSGTRVLTEEESEKLKEQDKRLVSNYRADKIEEDCKKNWDLFYKRNETKFFKDRHWTTREFEELLTDVKRSERRTLLEVGCGVGNFAYPLLEEIPSLFIYACDLSPRAVDFVKQHSLYDESRIKAFEADITLGSFPLLIEENVDICSLIFVLSAIHPSKFKTVLENLFQVVKGGGIVLFRDYGLYDMAQLRFKPGHKIAENLYVRQDCTRSYYFSVEEVKQLFCEAGFKVLDLAYIHRRTVNIKEKIDVLRIFVQGKFQKSKEKPEG